jgi:hypothetical protein
VYQFDIEFIIIFYSDIEKSCVIDRYDNSKDHHGIIPLLFKFKILFAMTVSILCIPNNELIDYQMEISELAHRLYTYDIDVRFLEEYVPPGGRVPGSGQQRVSIFRDFLIHQPLCLVIVYVDQVCCGFIMQLNVPFAQSVGFGIHPEYARKGIMSRAWQLVLENCACFKFPLYGYTSTRNTGSNSFLLSNGFQLLQDDIYFLGERSNKYVHDGSNR